MTKETKRGSSFPSGFARDEAKLVGPYPTWDGWKHTVETHLGINLKDLRDSTEVVLKEAYTIRRLIQLGGDPNSWDEFLERVDKENPTVLDEYNNIIRFIVERTEAQQIKSKAGTIRKM